MTSPIGLLLKNNRTPLRTSAFTLIELIVVMALLSTIFAIASPSLSRFFKGRTIHEEARRFLALTRYTQNQAISQSIPLELWIDTELNVYGVTPLPGFELEKTRTNEPEILYFEYDTKFLFELVQNRNRLQKTTSILFLPDGSLDETSLYAIAISQIDEQTQKPIENPILIAQTEFQTGFEIMDQEEYERQFNFHTILSGVQ